MQNILLDIGVIIILAGVGAYIAKMLRQPLIPAYILMGILLGPILHVVTDGATISSLSEIGIAFLLFSVGLELNINKLKEVGRVASIGGLIHMALLFGVSHVVFKSIGYDNMTAVYLGLILMFSSTLVVVKLLSDKKQLDTLHGRIIIGILLMQDIVAIIVMSLLSSIGKPVLSSVVLMFIEGIFVFLVGLALAKAVFGTIFKFAAKSEETLFILSIMIMFFFAIIYNLIGFSIVIGAFIAGLLLGSLPYNLEIIGRVKGIRDFFSVIFFVSIGLALTPVPVASIMKPLVVMLVLTFIALPILTMFVLALFGYKKRTAFLTGLSLAQISEFSLIIATLGVKQGSISPEIMSLTIIFAIITLSVTSYLIKFDDKLYHLFGRKMSWFEGLSRVSKEIIYLDSVMRNHVVLVGCDRIGYSIMQKLIKMKKQVVVVDINPDVVKDLATHRIPCIYGDIGDSEIADKLNLEEAYMVISTIPEHMESMMLINRVRKLNPDAAIIVTSYNAGDALQLYEKGADYVIVPHFLGGEHLSILMDDIAKNINKLLKIKVKHITALEERKERHPHHM